MVVGVLGLQGAFLEHLTVLRSLGADARDVRTPEQLAEVDRMILPGGESTTIGKLMDRFGLLAPIRERAEAGMPLWGTCAGMILMARKIHHGLPGQPGLALMDIEVDRNAFGRQVDSFQGNVPMPCLGEPPFPAVFIRAPLARSVGPEVEVLGRHDKKIVAARQGKLVVSAFHPELSGDDRFHRWFMEL
jgi:5'-phosphate synthase pdxT subunit